MVHLIDADKLRIEIEKIFPDSSNPLITEGFEYAIHKICKVLDTLEEEEKMDITNWEVIEKRKKDSEKALDYMRKHPLTHEEAVEQTKRLKSKKND